jgi:hypothetical protein
MAGIRHGDRMYATEDLAHFRRTKSGTIKKGTRGTVTGLRELEGDDGPQALVKFEGFGWPKHVRIHQISKTKPAGRS